MTSALAFSVASAAVTANAARGFLAAENHEDRR
jgi:hypothetical protein